MRICIIYNFAQHYRYGVFRLLGEYLDCDFYFGDKMGDVVKFDYDILPGFKEEFRNYYFFGTYSLQFNSFKLPFRNYSHYIMLGDYKCLSTWCNAFLCRVLGKKVYYWTHGWYGDETYFEVVIKKIFYNLANGVFLYGNFARELMIANGISSKKLHVIYNSLDYDSQLKIRNYCELSCVYQNQFKNLNPVIVFIGRLTKVKKLELLLDAQKYLLEENVAINVVFIGEGEEDESLRKTVNEMGLDSFVWFYGACYDERSIGNLIFNADICVSPGNVGLTAVHSLMYGTPVITHGNFYKQMPEFEAIVEGYTGMFFDEGCSKSLANVIKAWLAVSTPITVIRNQCYDRIDRYYNPYYQFDIIAKTLNDEKY